MEHGRQEEVVRALQLWDNVIVSLLNAQESWKEFSKVVGEGRLSIEHFPLDAQRVLSRANPHLDFSLFVDRFVDYARRNGGIETLRIGPSVIEQPPETAKPRTKTKDKGDA